MQANGQIVFSNGFAARVGVALAEDWYVEAVNWHGSFTFPPGTPFLEFLTATAREQESSKDVVVLCLEGELANLCGAATIEEERSPVSWRFAGSGSLIAAPKSGPGPIFSRPARTDRMKKLKRSAATPREPEPSTTGIDTRAALEEQLAAAQRQIIELSRDRLELQRARQGWEEDRARLQAALRSAPVIAFAQDRNQRYAWVECPHRPAWAELMRGKSDAELFRQDEAERLDAIRRRVLKAVRSLHKEVKLTTGQDTGYFTLYLEPRLDGGGQVRELSGALVDIGPQKAAAERRLRETAELRQKAEKYYRLFQQSADAIFVCSPEGRLVDVNPAAVELSGYASKTQLLDLNVGDLCDRIEDAHSFQQVMSRQGVVKNHPLTLKRDDGRRVDTLITAQALKDNTAQILAYEGTLRDVTEQKRLELRLLEAQKMEAVGMLAGGIAHDFNNLLMVIQGNAELGLSSLGEGEPAPELWHTILKAAQSGGRLVQQLIAFSSKQSLEPTVVNGISLSQILFKTLNRVNGDGIELRLDIAADPGELYVDQSTLEQIFLNIARNAREAMPQGGTLTVATGSAEPSEELRLKHAEARPQPYVRISVTDTGVGMDPETLAHVFEPFFTLKNAVSGLGLAAAYGLVRQQGGFIDASSKPQRGSRFDIYLPRH